MIRRLLKMMRYIAFAICFQGSYELFTVPSYYIGCYSSESMFRSSFECFFNDTCLQTINDLTYSTSKYPYNATVMRLNGSHYNVTTSVGDIINRLMIEEWNDRTSFQSYFEQCNPYGCTYSYNLKGDTSYVFAVTIGLVGGLTTILKVIIPFIIITIRQWQQKRRININQSMVDEGIESFHDNRETVSRKKAFLYDSIEIISKF